MARTPAWSPLREPVAAAAYFARTCSTISSDIPWRSSFRDQLHRLRVNRVGGARPGVGAPAAGEATDRLDRHVVVTEHLAAQAHAGQSAGSEHGLLGLRHLLRLAADELDAAGRAACVA